MSKHDRCVYISVCFTGQCLSNCQEDHQEVCKRFIEKKDKHDNYKNCINCQCLEWCEGDVGDQPGFCCFKRQDGMDSHKEHLFLNQLKELEFLFRSKKCFEAKDKK